MSDHAAPTASTAPIDYAARFAAFRKQHRYYGYRDIIADLFEGDEDAFLEAWVMGLLPADLAAVCVDTLNAERLTAMLLFRVTRQLGELISLTRALDDPA